MSLVQFQELLSYPESRWGETPLSRWVSLCVGLRDYQAPPKSLAIGKDRKWELTSAFQKSVRRGDKQMALRLVSAMDSMPEEYGYFWKRLCVIVCEDSQADLRDAVLRMREKGLKPTGCNSAIQALNSYAHWK